MTPKDWMKIESLLAGVADKDTLDAVKALVEGMETNLKGSLTANVVKSVQRGIITISSGNSSGTAEITAVNTAKAVELFCGGRWATSDSSDAKREDVAAGTFILTLTSATKVTATRGDSSSVGTGYVSYAVIEFY